MKRKVSIIIGLLLPLCSFSCTNHRINYIVEGQFFGINEHDASDQCYLEVTRINEDDYLAAAGVNVVEDLVQTAYYRIHFYAVNDLNEKTTYSFYHLRDAYDGATGTPVSYVDDNGSFFNPQGSKSEYAKGLMCYNISMHLEKEIFVYLHHVENGA